MTDFDDYSTNFASPDWSPMSFSSKKFGDEKYGENKRTFYQKWSCDDSTEISIDTASEEGSVSNSHHAQQHFSVRKQHTLASTGSTWASESPKDSDSEFASRTTLQLLATSHAGSHAPALEDLARLQFSKDELAALERAPKVWFDYGYLRYFDKLKNQGFMAAERDSHDIFVHFNDLRNTQDPCWLSHHKVRFVIVSVENEGKKRLWKAAPLKTTLDEHCLIGSTRNEKIKLTLKQILMSQIMSKFQLV